METLRRIPDHMDAWGMRLEQPLPSEFGMYSLVEVEQADIEQHHQVTVLDEDGRPLRGVWVIFGYPGGGPDLSYLMPDENLWRGAPAVLRGNARKTDAAGYVQHTFGTGGEDVWVWDVQTVKEPGKPWYTQLALPSPIVKNCSWQRPPLGRFDHTGVHLTFQRARVGVVTMEERLAALEGRVVGLERVLGK